MEGIPAGKGDTEAPVDHEQVEDEDANSAQQAHLLADGGEDEVGEHRWDVPRLTVGETAPYASSGSQGYQSLDYLVAPGTGLRPGVQPEVEPLLDYGNGVVAYIGGCCEGDEAQSNVQEPPAGYI